MNGKELWEKILAVTVGAWIGNKFGLLIPILCLLLFLMFLDYISGMVASKKEAIEHPNNKKYGWSSKKGVLGIYKKIGYILTVFVAICIDYLIYKFVDELGLQYNSHTYFGLLVTIWFIINEILSILENAGRMGVELPKFLKRTLTELQKDIDNTDSG